MSVPCTALASCTGTSSCVSICHFPCAGCCFLCAGCCFPCASCYFLCADCYFLCAGCCFPCAGCCFLCAGCYFPCASNLIRCTGYLFLCAACCIMTLTSFCALFQGFKAPEYPRRKGRSSQGQHLLTALPTWPLGLGLALGSGPHCAHLLTVCSLCSHCVLTVCSLCSHCVLSVLSLCSPPAPLSLCSPL